MTSTRTHKFPTSLAMSSRAKSRGGAQQRGICFLFFFAATVSFAQQPKPITFSDVTAAAGIRFTHNSGKTGKKLY